MHYVRGSYGTFYRSFASLEMTELERDHVHRSRCFTKRSDAEFMQ